MKRLLAEFVGRKKKKTQQKQQQRAKAQFLASALQQTTSKSIMKLQRIAASEEQTGTSRWVCVATENLAC